MGAGGRSDGGGGGDIMVVGEKGLAGGVGMRERKLGGKGGGGEGRVGSGSVEVPTLHSLLI